MTWRAIICRAVPDVRAGSGAEAELGDEVAGGARGAARGVERLGIDVALDVALGVGGVRGPRRRVTTQVYRHSISSSQGQHIVYRHTK